MKGEKLAIIYYTTKKNEEVFDFLQCDEEYMRIKKMVSQCYILPALQEVIQYGGGLYDFIVFDLDAIKDDVDEAVRQFSSYKTTERIVVYAEGRNKGDKIINDLIDIGVYNIITGTQINDIREQIRKCVSIEGMSYADLNGYLSGDIQVKEEKSCERFTSKMKKNSNIFVLGTEPNVGTTTICFNILAFLRELGISCAYLPKQDTDLFLLERFYNVEEQQFLQRDTFFEYNNIHFYKAGYTFIKDYDFIIWDMGYPDEDGIDNISSLYNSESARKILVSGAKPWELEQIAKFTPHLSCDKVDLILQFVNLNNSSQIKNLFKDIFKTVNFTDYMPDFFDTSKSRELWTSIFKELLLENHSQRKEIGKIKIDTNESEIKIKPKKDKGLFKKHHFRKK
ncbi:MAG: hypothetical protein RR233_08820 [Clostridiales bacterium]